MNHWAFNYMGLEHRRGATGPDAYDCLGFVTEIQRVRFGITMSPIDRSFEIADDAKVIRDHPERQQWVEVDKPQEGDVVLMARRKIPVHIGVWIQANGTVGVLHCVERAGVIFSTIPNLAIQGWGSVSFFRHWDRV
jgi:cell wall-associated NlpC family hydrolase